MDAVEEAEKLLDDKNKFLVKTVQGLKVMAHKALRARGIKVSGVYTCYKKTVSLFSSEFRSQANIIRLVPRLIISTDALNQVRVTVDPGSVVDNNCSFATRTTYRPRKDGTINFALAAERLDQLNAVHRDRERLDQAREAARKAREEQIDALRKELGVTVGESLAVSYADSYGLPNSDARRDEIYVRIGAYAMGITKGDVKKVKTLVDKIDAIFKPYKDAERVRREAAHKEELARYAARLAD